MVINNTGSTSASVNTGANFLTVTGTLNVLNPATTIAISGSSFAVKAASLGSNIDTLRLSGGTTTLNCQTWALAPGLDIRAWQSGTSAASLDTYTGGAGANPPNVSYDPGSLAGKIGTSDVSTFAGTLNPMNLAGGININLTGAEWFQNGGMGTGSITAPTGYINNYTAEYRGKLYIAAAGTYYFATTSDDGSALWIDPGTNNPAYANANVQNNYAQGMTLRTPTRSASRRATTTSSSATTRAAAATD